MREDAPAYSGSVLRYLDRLYAHGRQAGPDQAENFRTWQGEARERLRRLMGLDRMGRELAGWRPTVELGDAEPLDGLIRRCGHIEAEPDVRVPFWLLRPAGDGPFPLAITPHGHGDGDYDMYAGVAGDEARRRRMVEEDRDVAAQAAREGFVAIAPATRGFLPVKVPDRKGRHGDRDCRSQQMHCLAAGRTALAERVWDVQRLIDWAGGLGEVHGGRVLVTGNSGGGMVTTYAAAMDPRIGIAVPSCSFAPLVSLAGDLHHCDCNMIPGILRWGEIWHVAGLIAPRHLCVVTGREDPLFDPPEVDRATAKARELYALAGTPGRFEHHWGPAGHRFYKDLMWPFVRRALAEMPA